MQTENGRVLEEYVDTAGAVGRLAALASMESSICLRFIDPYGDTIFNQLQLPELIREIEAAATSADPETRRAGSEVARLARFAANRVHTYIKFIGD